LTVAGCFCSCAYSRTPLHESQIISYRPSVRPPAKHIAPWRTESVGRLRTVATLAVSLSRVFALFRWPCSWPTWDRVGHVGKVTKQLGVIVTRSTSEGPPCWRCGLRCWRIAHAAGELSRFPWPCSWASWHLVAAGLFRFIRNSFDFETWED
jgi:hypothetical protein